MDRACWISMELDGTECDLSGCSGQTLRARWEARARSANATLVTVSRARCQGRRRSYDSLSNFTLSASCRTESPPGLSASSDHNSVVNKSAKPINHSLTPTRVVVVPSQRKAVLRPVIMAPDKRKPKPAADQSKPNGQPLASYLRPSQGLLRDVYSLSFMRHPASSGKIIGTIYLAWLACFIARVANNPFSRFVMISHPVPLSSSLLSSKTFLSTVQGTRYFQKGYDDLYFIGFHIIVFAFLRAMLVQKFLQPLAVWSGLKGRKRDRFTEQGYAIIYHGIFSVFGLVVYKDLPVWWYRTDAFWKGYPHWQLLPQLKLYYLLQFSYWLCQMLVLILRIEAPRTDFLELCIHHAVTLWLVFWSGLINLTYIGVAVFVSMDVPEVFLAAAKMLNYHKKTEKISEVVFVIFIGVWTYFRHYENLRILYSVWFDYDRLVPQESQVFFNADTGAWLAPWMKYQVFTPIALLQVVNLFWYFLIWRLLYRLLILKELKDTREDQEDVVIADELEESIVKKDDVPGADAVVYEPRAIKVDWQDDELTITQMDSTLTARQISRDSTPRGDMLSMELTASIRNEDRHGWSYTAAACCGEFTAKIHVGLSLGTLQTVHSATWLERRCHTDWEIYADCRGMQEAGYCDIREAKVEIIRNILT
ncbi:uncharacterized protein L969DRAFT_92487 [Mixia osmundae IAM 14324]|uniref:TLC domain-containing protein n=1 Tax=Mixia osmundae (strain CBS 9802 / IAM 14324 / JCM 22182 / KY 12970) TaxID=764103 RepID=G7DXE3_MIXOS|nr:uncharacterized protein L969DRAFT_92487 [Mixia osmundae IAM 14324]KEI41253.1 hypothetical protein L969DRAFT_92487 [Mixia osmundae IAM 14324]GAA95253.1 hypothetical protein E5Q_01909 [Mixia osmundae IAM 14324]